MEQLAKCAKETSAKDMPNIWKICENITKYMQNKCKTYAKYMQNICKYMEQLAKWAKETSAKGGKLLCHSLTST